MHKSKSLFNCSGAGTGEPGAVKAASPGSGRDGQKRSAHTEPRWPSTLQHLGESTGRYRRAFGNRRSDESVKRLGTGDRYCEWETHLWQVAWRNQEPPWLEPWGVSVCGKLATLSRRSKQLHGKSMFVGVDQRQPGKIGMRGAVDR